MGHNILIWFILCVFGRRIYIYSFVRVPAEHKVTHRKAGKIERDRGKLNEQCDEMSNERALNSERAKIHLANLRPPQILLPHSVNWTSDRSVSFRSTFPSSSRSDEELLEKRRCRRKEFPQEYISSRLREIVSNECEFNMIKSESDNVRKCNSKIEILCLFCEQSVRITKHRNAICVFIQNDISKSNENNFDSSIEQ